MNNNDTDTCTVRSQFCLRLFALSSISRRRRISIKSLKRFMKRVRVCSATLRCPPSDCSTINYVSKMIQRQVIKRPHIRYPIPNPGPPINQPINEYKHIA